MGKFCQISTVMALDLRQNSVFRLYLEHLLTNFLHTLYRSLYREGVIWDWRSLYRDLVRKPRNPFSGIAAQISAHFKMKI